MLMISDQNPVTTRRVLWLPLFEENGNTVMKLSFTNIRTFGNFPFIWYQNASSALSDSVFRQIIMSLKETYLNDEDHKNLKEWLKVAMIPNVTGNVDSTRYDIAGVLMTNVSWYIVYGLRQDEKIFWNMELIPLNEPTAVTESHFINRYLNQYFYQQSEMGAYTVEYAENSKTHVANVLKLFNERNPNQVNRLICLPIQDYLEGITKAFIEDKSSDPVDFPDWALTHAEDRVKLEDATLPDFEEIRHQFLMSKVEQQVLPEVKGKPKKTKVTRKKKEVMNETK
jgi:hypothetical protein